jgi:endoglucanase
MESITNQEISPAYFGFHSNKSQAHGNIQRGIMTQSLIKPVGRMFYLHRCGVALDAARAGEYAHPACHTAPARVFGTDTFLHVSGGWHDAGDYGRYVVPACKAVADLLLAFRAAPEAFGDDWDIPESGNGVADVLDEVRFALEWLLRMQRDDGAVYHKLTCAYFPDITALPQDETADLFVFPVSTAATGDFSAVMALAAPLYESIDRTFSKKCLRASLSAYEFLKHSEPLPFHNPPGVVTGQYDDENDADERYFAACALYQATGQSYYLTDAAALYQGGRSADFGWADMGGYGNAALLFGPRTCEDAFLAGRIRADLIATADRICERTEKSPLGISITEFLWGSNMYLLNHTMTLLLANDAQESERYLAAARSHLDYILGNNPLGVNYITGVSETSPKNPHHRPSAAVGRAMPGMLVGGPDEGLHDLAAKTLLAGKPAAERYIDSVESYSTNETAIYWNSVLLYVLARMSRLEA